MKNFGIAALAVGICLEALAIFGNRMPYPLVLNIVCPDYVEAKEGYDKLLLDGLLEPSDPGFDLLRVACLRFMLRSIEELFSVDELEGHTIARFYGGATTQPAETKEKSVVIAEFSNGQNIHLDYGAIQLMANDYRSANALLVNCGLLILGCALVYYGLRIVFLDSKPSGDGEGRREGAFQTSQSASDGG